MSEAVEMERKIIDSMLNKFEETIKREAFKEVKRRKWLVNCPNCSPEYIGEKVKGKCPHCNGTKQVYMIPLSYIKELEKECEH